MKYLLALLMLVALAVPATAREVVPPTDATAPYLTVAGTPGNGGFEALRFAFEVNPQLKAIKRQCHFAVLSTRDAAYQERYADEFTELPAVRLQQPDGTVVYEVAGESIPIIDELAVELKSHLDVVTCHRRERTDSQGYDVAPPKKAEPVIASPKAVADVVPLWRVVLFGSIAVLIGWLLGLCWYVADEWSSK